MRTKILTIPEIKDIVLEMLVNKTDKITKISDNSVLNGMVYGAAKIFQKGMKDCSLIESEIFFESAFGEHLDIVANRYGIPARKGACGSSTFIRIVALPNTDYDHTKVVFMTGNGTRFSLSESFTMGSNGYHYANVFSNIKGSSTNVLPNSINKAINVEAGHRYCINEFYAQGGQDEESDFSLKKRISQIFNLSSTNTLANFEQILIENNPNILSIEKLGTNSKGKAQIFIKTINGADLMKNEIDFLTEKLRNNVSLSDMGWGKSDFEFELKNCPVHPINISFRVNLSSEVDIDEFRKNVQISISNYLNWEDIDPNFIVRWIDIYNIVRSQSGVLYLPDQYFFPNTDISIVSPYLPRVVGFKMYNMSGGLILDNSNLLNPIYYQNIPNVDYKEIILSNL